MVYFNLYRPVKPNVEYYLDSNSTRSIDATVVTGEFTPVLKYDVKPLMLHFNKKEEIPDARLDRYKQADGVCLTAYNLGTFGRFPELLYVPERHNTNSNMLSLEMRNNPKSFNNKVNTSMVVINSSVKISMFKETIISSGEVELISTILDAGLGSGTGAGSVSNTIDFTIEVHRFEYRKFKFPTQYLTGMENIGIAKVIGDTLEIYSTQFGKYMLVGDNGQITINVVPGFSIKPTFQVLPNVSTPPTN